MFNYLRIILCVLPVLLVFNSHSQDGVDLPLKSEFGTSTPIDSIAEVIQEMIGEDWFVVKEENGFKVFFCRSCQNEYVDFRNEQNQSKELWPDFKRRSAFLSLEDLDSVSYFATVGRGFISSRISDSLREVKMKEIYSPNGILSFEIIFDEKWSKNRIDSVQMKNDLLQNEIINEPLFKTSLDIFSDYRFWLPADYFRERTANYDFYFQRLPYDSKKLDYSIFIIQDKPYFFSEACYVDKSDPLYFYNERNFLEVERRRTLKTIALVLGVSDYRIVN